MKPPPFSYHDPRTVPDVIGLLGRLDNAKLLAGGQSLMPMLNMRFVLPDHIIDLNRVEGLSYIREHGYGFVEFARRHGDFAIVSAAALLTENATGEITRASVTIGGVAVAPIRAHEVETALLGQVPEDKLLRDVCELCRKFEAIED